MKTFLNLLSETLLLWSFLGTFFSVVLTFWTILAIFKRMQRPTKQLILTKNPFAFLKLFWLGLYLFNLECVQNSCWFNIDRPSIISDYLLWHHPLIPICDIRFFSCCFSHYLYRCIWRHPNSRHWCIWCRLNVLSFSSALSDCNLVLRSINNDDFFKPPLHLLQDLLFLLLWHVLILIDS